MGRSSTSWVKGKSGNINGRPKSHANIAKFNFDILSDLSLNHARDYFKVLHEHIMQGNIPALKMYCEYTMGRPKDFISSLVEEESDVVNLPIGKEGRLALLKAIEIAEKELEQS